jgi:hypothetical protein
METSNRNYPSGALPVPAERDLALDLVAVTRC